MKNDDNRLRTIIIVGIIAMALVVIGVLLFVTNNANSGPPTQTERIDPASGEVIQDTDGKTPERYGVDPNQPGYLGFVELLDRGMTTDDVDNAKNFLTDYATKQVKDGKPKISQISIKTDSVMHNIQSATYEETFKMTLVVDNNQQLTFTVTTNAETNIRTLTLAQGEAVVYSTQQNM